MVFRATVDVIKSMVGEYAKVDKATTEYRKVSNLSGKDLENYTSKLAKLGTETGRTAAEIIESAAQFRKSGFNDEDAATLANVASMYRNIADTEVSASDAAASITSQIRAFGWEAEDAMHIIDAYNEVSNNFSVGTNDLKNDRSSI